MSRTSWVNLSGVLAAFGIALAGAARRPMGDGQAHVVRDAHVALPDRRVRLPDGRTGLTDLAGHTTVLRNFRRIASLSTVADRLLVELCEPDRVVAFSGYGARQSPWAYQYAGKAHLESNGDIERILALSPDLVLLNSFSDPRRLERIRQAGIEVFDLGEMRGVTTFVTQIELVAALVGHPERGQRYAHAFELRLHAVAHPPGTALRQRGLYLSVMGTELYGGALGTGYHDVLTAAGLIDVAAARYRDWPRYDIEQVLAMDPQVIVTKTGMANVICRYPGLAALQACRGDGALIELPEVLLEEAGPTILDAAELLHERVYGTDREPVVRR